MVSDGIHRNSMIIDEWKIYQDMIKGNRHLSLIYQRFLINNQNKSIIFFYTNYSFLTGVSMMEDDIVVSGFILQLGKYVHFRLIPLRRVWTPNLPTVMG